MELATHEEVFDVCFTELLVVLNLHLPKLSDKVLAVFEDMAVLIQMGLQQIADKPRDAPIGPTRVLVQISGGNDRFVSCGSNVQPSHISGRGIF